MRPDPAVTSNRPGTELAGGTPSSGGPADLRVIGPANWRPPPDLVSALAELLRDAAAKRRAADGGNRDETRG
jgi:hypothetical protein